MKMLELASQAKEVSITSIHPVDGVQVSPCFICIWWFDSAAVLVCVMLRYLFLLDVYMLGHLRNAKDKSFKHMLRRKQLMGFQMSAGDWLFFVKLRKNCCDAGAGCSFTSENSFCSFFLKIPLNALVSTCKSCSWTDRLWALFIQKVSETHASSIT